MNDHGRFSAPDTICLERLLPGPIERLWAYLTEPDKRATWLAGGPMELISGGRVGLRFDHDNLSAEPTPERYAAECGAAMTGHITRCEPPRLLAYTWSEESGSDSEVCFELEPRGEQVLLTLTHRRLGERTTVISVAAGWHAHLGVLEDRLKGDTPRPFWSTHARLEQEYEQRIPK